MTRARRQVIVFSSFSPSDLRAEETSSVGIKHLRSYLDLAEQGTGSLPYDGRRTLAADLHREEIADALRDRGFAVATDVGLSDFKVDISVASPDTPDRPSMAILLDSPAWAARRTVGDRDGLPGDVLTRMMRWPSVQRVWLPAWISDREGVRDKLESAFAAASGSAGPVDCFVDEPGVVAPAGLPPAPVSAGPAAGVPPYVPVGVPAPLLASAAAPTSAPGGSRAATAVVEPEIPAYQPWTVRRFGSIDVLDTLGTRRSVAAVREAVNAIVQAEGPVHQERLARLACAAFGLNKVNAQRAKSVLDVLDTSAHRCDEEGFIWDASLDGDTPGWSSGPTGPRSTASRNTSSSRSSGTPWRRLSGHPAGSPSASCTARRSGPSAADG